MTVISPDRIAPVSYRLANEDADAFADALGRSFREYGFAVISDHGIDPAVIDAALADARAFFALPETTKRAYHQDGLGGARGYTPFATEVAKGATEKDLKEFWHRGRDLPAGHRLERFMPPNLPVAEVPGFDASTKALFEALDEMGRVLLRAIARDLGLADDWFEPSVDEGNSILRLLHYPPIEGEPAGVRAEAHEDINVITLLLGAEEAGLQVKTRSGEWLPIQPPAGALVVNIGDMLQRLTNHVLPSTTHRVVNPPAERMGRSRYSTPFFLHFNPDFEIRTLEGCATPDNPDRYPEPITADAYLQQRLREIGLK
ncbi:flavonol synthase [Marinicauda salina]|uniref:2-oxoglutarate-dependent ethylene/succinate-forming enzyme n=1 Tax=Marinicauda salina TaxID=2135793 RepID=A0A2U2BV92_9PROT|nr:2-oxoglutarate and iron-dependent oxygenase domain-containing protein [Marinicauda salina]PWE17884.1 flavonol synthase [Marinicauda salina]